MTTLAEKARFKFLMEYGCICCRLIGNGYAIPQMHHIVDKGNRAASGGHAATLPLCPWHHQGKLPGSYKEDEATRTFGPSLAHGSRPFHAMWGTQRELLAIIDLAIMDNSRPTERTPHVAPQVALAVAPLANLVERGVEPG
jgi:hypothetical protein